MAGAFLKDAVVTIGENPESLASWMLLGERMGMEPMWMGGVRLCLPIWPTDEAPPKTTMGFPFILAHCVRCCECIKFQSVRVVVV